MPGWIGAAVALAGAVLIAAAIGLFRRSGENVRPDRPTNTIIDTGLYRWSRNPMYLGMAVLMLGLAILLKSGMAVLMVPVAMMVIANTVIAREEDYLSAKFGAPYRAYLTRVGRWF